MRTIKFRVWDGKEMHADIVAIIYAKGGSSRVEAVTLLSHLGKEPPFDVIRFSTYHKARLLQFTGLLDADGREIYEGDRLGYPDENPVYVGYPEEGSVYVVVFEQGAFRKDFLNGKTSLPKPLLDTFDTLRDYITSNIYEHPHLLETVDV